MKAVFSEGASVFYQTMAIRLHRASRRSEISQSLQDSNSRSDSIADTQARTKRSGMF